MTISRLQCSLHCGEDDFMHRGNEVFVIRTEIMEILINIDGFQLDKPDSFGGGGL